MDAFASFTTTAQALESALAIKADDFDKDFLAWLDRKYGDSVRGFGEWKKRQLMILGLLKAKQADQAEEIALQQIAVYPEYVEEDNAYEALAEARLLKKNPAGAIEALQKYARTGGKSPELLKKLATLQEEAGNFAGAESALARLIGIAPVNDEDLHRKLGDLRARLGQWPGAAEEFGVVVASQPVDTASARYHYARALMKSGNTSEAQNQVLAALEAAPGYRDAQKLLLEIEAISGKKD
jgi:predicted Zn-dependent protease